MKSAKTFTYWVDIVGACNLRCPSCARGNFKSDDVISALPPAGLMDFGLFKDVLRKIKLDGPSLNPQVHLYNWGEPLLHPEVAKFVEYTLGQGLYCGLSANLNYDRTLRDVIKAGPDFFRVSLSGYYQQNYGRTHRRGNIERVKANMRKVREYMDEFDKNVYVQVNYHVYRHNAGADLEKMIEFCNELKFHIGPVWAFYLPLEKNLDIVNGKIKPEDQKLLDLYVIPPKKAMELAMPHRHKICPVRERAMVINFDGSVPLCCNTFDQAHNIAKSFLELEHEELQQRKHDNPLCGPCMDNAIHVYLAYEAGDVMDKEGNRVLREMNNPLEIHQYEKGVRVVSREKGPLPIIARPEEEISTRRKVRGIKAIPYQLADFAKRLSG